MKSQLQQSVADRSPNPPLLVAMLLTAAAAGMGWGIRGQYGHETGAMVPGLLVGLTIACLFAPRSAKSLWAARVAALTAIGISFGGSMTYGQTVGLTHDQELVGNWPALWWGMLGLFIKGGIWIGLAGAFLGIGLNAQRHRPLNIALLMVALVFLLFAGVWLLNEPFDPANRKLPSIYFSDDWHWEPDKQGLEPRRERWGGLLLALIGTIGYLQCKRDGVARNLALFGFIFGGLGFSLGQSLQAAHAWNPQQIDNWLGWLAPHVNWWNMMETTFGLFFGAGLALGVWLHRHRIANEQSEPHAFVSDAPFISQTAEFCLLLLHAAAIAVWNLYSYRPLDFFADLAITMGIIPAVCVLAGRYSAYWVALPIVALPIAGKTLRQLSYERQPPYFDVLQGWIYLFVVPILVMIGVAWYFASRQRNQMAHTLARWMLLQATWFYFALNFLFFELPWPWEAWTGRTPNALIFFACAVLLTVLSLWPRKQLQPG